VGCSTGGAPALLLRETQPLRTRHHTTSQDQELKSRIKPAPLQIVSSKSVQSRLFVDPANARPAGRHQSARQSDHSASSVDSTSAARPAS
jgi:hypothetical protein